MMHLTRCAPPMLYALRVGEIAIVLLLAIVLFISDPERLENALERLRELSAWLAE